MTDKEKLEIMQKDSQAILETRSNTEFNSRVEAFVLDHMQWLVNQAKQNLSSDKQSLIKANIEKQKKIDKQQEEIETLGAALYDAKHEIRVLKGRQRK